MAVLDALVDDGCALPASVPQHDFECVARLVFFTANASQLSAMPAPTDTAKLRDWWAALDSTSTQLQQMLAECAGVLAPRGRADGIYINIAQFKEKIKEILLM